MLRLASRQLLAVTLVAAATVGSYERNRLDDDEAHALLAKLEEFMSVRRAYLDPNLTLSTLADALAITPHMLSQLLNVWVGKSFFMYAIAQKSATKSHG